MYPCPSRREDSRYPRFTGDATSAGRFRNGADAARVRRASRLAAHRTRCTGTLPSVRTCRRGGVSASFLAGLRFRNARLHSPAGRQCALLSKA